jgi:hypothetical protein
MPVQAGRFIQQQSDAKQSNLSFLFICLLDGPGLVCVKLRTKNFN